MWEEPPSDTDQPFFWAEITELQDWMPSVTNQVDSSTCGIGALAIHAEDIGNFSLLFAP